VLGVGTTQGALEAVERGNFELVLLDLWLGSESGLDVIPEILHRQPGIAVVVITAFATFESAVEAIKRGACDYLPKPFSPDQVRSVARRAVQTSRLRRDVSQGRPRAADGNPEVGVFETESPTYRTFLQNALRAAGAEVPVLLRGESGSGKNVLARWLWSCSARREAPFVGINCASVSPELMSATLFGHRKDAFAGASDDAPGTIEAAEGGILFLDEVSALSLDSQSRLLRFLDDRTYEPVGEAKGRSADVRIIAATNRPLEDLVRAGRFREDLFFRLNVLALQLPALRERKEDVLPLARFYLERGAKRQHRPEATLSARAERAIVAHDWPGNLRELRNAVERALILCPGPNIAAEDLGIPTPSEEGAPAPGTVVALGADVSLEALEREHIARVAARGPTLEAAARILGIDVTTLQRKRKRYGLA
jgi:NtrC-family two-component system response regulator AlgB